METKNRKKPHIYIPILASIGIIFSCIYIGQTLQESKIYDRGENTKNISTDNNIYKKITKIQQTLEANQALQDKQYQKALTLISGTTSEDYYNRGTIQTLLAYQYALQNSISGLQQAQIFVAEAQNSFSIAKQLSSSKTISKAIQKNEATVQSLAPIIDIKTCYGIGQSTIQEIKSIISTIQDITKTLEKEETYIAKRKNTLDKSCYTMLDTILNTSKQQVKLVQLQITKNHTKHLSEFSNKLQDPLLCIQTPYENIIPTLLKGKQGLIDYQSLHQNTIDALQKNDNKSIEELCNQTKNDAQINQQIEDSVQELLETLDKTKENKQTKSTQEIKYKDFFDKNEQQTLQEIQKTNTLRIDTVLKTKGKGNYTPQRYIDEMFNQFYGNSGDFIDLHK